MNHDSDNGWDVRYSSWLEFVRSSAEVIESGAKIPVGPSQPPLVPTSNSVPAPGAAKILLCSPHPDDEALTGALPLRIRMECGARVVNCAVTLGSDPAQKERRLRELESACRVLGFDLLVPKSDTGPRGFNQVNPETRANCPKEWAAKVEIFAELLARENPDAVFAPHAEDFNTTHIGTYFLVTDALAIYLKRSSRNRIPLIETEYWHQMFAPNLMVGVAPEVVAVQLMAAAEHGGEVLRNPYHLRQPARMMDNVRRGSEVVGGQGGNARTFPFAELYRVGFVSDSALKPSGVRLIVSPEEKVDLASLLAHFS